MSGEEHVTALERDATQLTWAAIRLDQARMTREVQPVALVEAMEMNLQLWIAIKTRVQSADTMPAALRSNLVRLADFVAGSILKGGIAIENSAIDAIINVNLQVSEGLLDTQR